MTVSLVCLGFCLLTSIPSPACGAGYRPDAANGLPLGFDLPITTTYWDPPAEGETDEAFDAMLARVEAEGSVLLKGGAPRL